MRKEIPQESRLLQQLIDSSLDGHLAFDLECRYTAWNRAMERISGFTREQVLGRRAFDVFPFLKDTGEDRYFFEALQGKSPVAHERVYIIPETGRRGFFDGYYSPLRDERGEVTGGTAIIRDITERKLAEDALRASEERYRAFLANSSEGIWRFELEQPVSIDLAAPEQVDHFYRYGYLAECNDAMARMYGFERAEEIRGARLGDLLVRSDPNNAEYLNNFIAAGYRLTDVESVEVDRNGEQRIFLNNLVGVVEDRLLLRAWGTQRDVTERRKGEVELRATEHRFSMFMENLPGLAWIKDLEGRYVYANLAATRAFNTTRAELYGKTDDELFPPETAAQFKANDRQAVYGGSVQTVETLEQEDGLHYSIVSKFPVLGANGETQLVGGVAVDITERKQAEEEARRLAAIVEATTDFVAVARTDGPVIYINRAGRRMVGIPEDADITEFSRATLSPPWVYERTVREWLPRAMREGSASGEGALLTLSGEEIPVSFVLLVQRNSNGEPEYISTIARDISERKLAEEEREQLLMRAQSARAVAESANRMKDEFLATVSHELRTPLTAVVGWSRMLRAGNLDRETAEHALDVILRNAQAQAQIVEDILEVSRIVTGKIRLNMQMIDPTPPVSAAIDAVRPAAEAKGITVESALDPRAGPVRADPDRFQQIAWNLLSNAVKFTPAGGRVEVRLSDLNGHARLEVRDTGQGISPEFLPFVFERFRQADSSSTRQHGGLGLGLAIVRHLTELHGGTVQAESAGAGCGATFFVDIPREKITPEKELLDTRLMPDVSAETQARAVSHLPDLRGARVLVLEDEADTRDFLAALLKRCRAEVKTAASVPEALRLFIGWGPQLIVSDLGIPGEDGFSFIRKVRELEPAGGERTPALALSGYARSEDRALSLASGFQQHLGKPVEPFELMRVIVGLLDRDL